MALERKSDWNSPTAPTSSIYQFRSIDWNAMIDHTSGYINVTEPPYSADPTGVVDAGSAIDAASTIAFAAGVSLLLPAGTYKRSTDWVIPSSAAKVHIRGIGKEASVISYTGSGVGVKVGDSTPGSSRPLVENLKIVGTSAGVAGIQSGVFNGFRMDNVWITGFSTGTALLLKGTNEVLITDSFFNNSLIGVDFASDGSYFPNLVKILGGQIAGNATAIRSLVSSQGVKFDHVNFASTTASPVILAQRALNWVIQGNFFENNHGGAGTHVIELGGSASGSDVSHAALVIGNFFTEANGITYPIQVVRGSRNSAWFNQFAGSHTALVRVEVNADGVSAGFNYSSGGDPQLSDASGTVDAMGIGPGTNLYKSPNGYAFGDDLGGKSGRPLQLVSVVAGEDVARFRYSTGAILGRVTDTGHIRVVGGLYPGTTAAAEQSSTGIFVGTAVPASGTWALGAIVFNSSPSVGQPKAWVCTVAGTPGTWVSTGNL